MKFHKAICKTLSVMMAALFLFSSSALAKINLDADKQFLITNSDGEQIAVWANMVPNPGSGQCWAYANSIYKIIWGVNFASNFAGSNSAGYNTLRDLDASERKMTAENVKRFITHAAPGASIRITACTEECSNFKGDSCKAHEYGHNLILVSKTETGFTAIHRGTERQCTEYTWASFVKAWPKYTYFKYIKYPGAMSIEWEITPVTGTFVFVRDDESRHDCYESSPLVKRYSMGERVDVVGSVVNGGGNAWYQLTDGAYVFSGDLEAVTCRHERYCGEKTCLICDEPYEGDNMYHIGETVVQEGVSATCSADGKTEGARCSNCNEMVIPQEIIPATGHTEGEWVIVTEATEEAEGLMEKYCEVCKTLMDTRIIPKIEGDGERLPGDVNRDGVVDGRDVLRMAKYVAGFDEEIDIANASVNGDDVVDGRDILRLAKYIGGFDVTLK